jgi:hypothetical protein
VLATVQPVPGTSEASMPRLDRSGTKVAVLVSFGTQHVDYRVAVYDLDRHTARLVGASGTHAYSMNPNGLLIQRGSGELEWWDTAGTTMHKSIRLDRSLVTREVVLSSDPALGERLFVQRRTDGNLMLVDLVTDSVVGTLQLPNSGLNAKVSMLFPAGDRELVTVIEGDEVFEPGDHGQILRLDLDPAEWIVAACASSGRNLDDAEWRRLVGTEPPEDLRCLR